MTMKPTNDNEKADVEKADGDENGVDDVQASPPISLNGHENDHSSDSGRSSIDPATIWDEPVEPISRHSTRRAQSRASSNRSRALVIIPRSKRRGLFASLALVPEAESPYEYKNSTKWFITFVIALATAAAPLGSTVFYREFIALSIDDAEC